MPPTAHTTRAQVGYGWETGGSMGYATVRGAVPYDPQYVAAHTETVYRRQREQHEVDGKVTDMVTSDPPTLTERVWLSSVSV